MAHARSITLTNEEVLYLQSLTRQRTIQAQVVDRAKMLLYKAQGASNSDIAERLDVNINTVKLCLSKFREGGVQRALFDDKRKGRPVEMTLLHGSSALLASVLPILATHRNFGL